MRFNQVRLYILIGTIWKKNDKGAAVTAYAEVKRAGQVDKASELIMPRAS